MTDAVILSLAQTSSLRSELDEVIRSQQTAQATVSEGFEPFTLVVLSCTAAFAVTGWMLMGWMAHRFSVRSKYDIDEDYRYDSRTGGSRLDDPPAKQAKYFGALIGAAVGFFGIRSGWNFIQLIPYVVLPGLLVGAILGWAAGRMLTRSVEVVFAWTYGGKVTPVGHEPKAFRARRMIGAAIGALIGFFGAGIFYNLIQE